MGASAAPSPRSPLAPWAASLVAALWFALLHGRAVDTGLLSDAWSMLLAAARPWDEALGHAYRYHTIPVTNLLTALEWRCFGLAELPYQVLNLAGVLGVALLFRRFAAQLTGDGRLALVAMLLFLANASYFQIVYWPVVGTFQSLGVAFYLLALDAVLARRPGRFAGFSALAFFTYEPMVSVLAVGAALLWLNRGSGTEASRLASFRPWLLAGGLVVLAIAVAKTPALVGDGEVVNPARGTAELATRVGVAARGVFATLTLRASTPSLGLGFDRPVLAAGWFVAFAALAAWAAWRGSRATRLAVFWFALHLLLLTVSTRIASRHLYLLALPAALLGATTLLRLAERLPRHAAASLWALGVLGPAAFASRDLARADRAAELATAATRDLHARLDERIRAGGLVHVVDLPAIVGREGVPAFAFLNGVHARLELVHGPSFDRRSVRLWTTRTAPAGPKLFANGSRPLGVGELEALLADGGATVLVWNSELGRVEAKPPGL